MSGFKKNHFSRPQLLIFIIAFSLIGYLIFKSFALNPNLPGDLNNDNTVNVMDMSILLSNYGTSNAAADINTDGTVNVLDMSILLSHYGQSLSTGFTNTVKPSISGTASVGSTLTASPGTWTPTPSGYGYAWDLCDSAGNNCGLSPTAVNQSTYVIQSGDTGHTIRVNVGPKDSSGTTQWAVSVLSNATGVIGGSGGGTAGPTFGGPTIYAANSPWNTAIPANVAIHPDSNTMINGVWYSPGTLTPSGNPHAWGSVPNYAYAAWLGPRQNVGRTWLSVASTPTTTVSLDFPSCGYKLLQVPIPSNLIYHQDFASTDDEHRTDLQMDDGSTWNIEYLTPPNTASYEGCGSNSYWHAGVVEHRNDGSGWQGRGDGYKADGVSPWTAGAAAKTPMDGGAVTPQDMMNVPVGGHLNHALNVNISNTSGGSPHPKYVWPAASGDGTTSNTLVGIPMGARIQLDPSLTTAQLQALGLTKEWQLQMARTMQIYGLITTDTAGAQGAGDGFLATFPQQTPNYTYPWVADGSGWSYGSSMPTALMSHFRVIDWNSWTGR